LWLTCKIAQVHGIAAAFTPVLHLRRIEPSGMLTTCADSFERVWTTAAPLDSSAHA
jgi:hypothetical protein